MTRHSAIVMVLLTTGMMVGCTNTKEWGGQTHDGHPVRSYVSLSPSTTELVQAATGNAAQLVIGRTSNCDYPYNLPGKIVVSGTEPNYELIAELKPEIVIYEKDLYSEATIAKINELGFDTKPIETDSFAAFRKTLIDLAQASGSELTASAYLDSVENNLDVLRTTIKEGTTACAIIGGPTEGYLADGTSTLLADLFNRAHGKFLGPDASRYQPVGIEQIVQWNPDLIITTEQGMAGMLKDPAMQTIPAVKEGRIIGFKDAILLRDGARVDKLLEGLASGIDRIQKLKGN